MNQKELREFLKAQPDDIEHLDLSNEELTKLPPTIGRFRSLQTLNLDDNQLTSLPAELSSLTSLTWLYLDNNELTLLSAELSSLTSLKGLYLHNNQLTSLPAELSSLTSLTWLYLDGNPLKFPPPEIVQQGPPAILSFLKKILEERTLPSRVWVSKLLLVGEGGVGKSSLLRQLRSEGFRKGESTTHGIEIRELSLPHPELEEVEMKLVAWDFGGQEIYHATHQFFLTNRSLFLLVWNVRIGYEASKLDYWLETIHAKAPDSPIMLVATGIDDGRPVDLPMKDLKARFPKIEGLWKVSNSAGTGIDELRDEIDKVAAGLPLMGEQWPKTWIAAAEAVRSQTERHVSPNEFVQIMAGHGLVEEEQGILARWLHELGDILYYRDKPELNDVVILKPQWVNQEICKVLDSNAVKDCGGIFRRTDRDQLWSDIDPGLRDLFLRLMEQFDLSYRTLADPELSLVVEHLSLDEHKDFEQRWEQFGQEPGCRQITMKFVLSVMPPGIPTWFIARSHRFTQNIHWKRGALFGEPRESPEHLGMIRAMPSDKTVILSVRGPFPHNYFAVLRDGLELT
jgi:internalin A